MRLVSIYCTIRRLCITCIARASRGILNAGDLEKRCVHAWSVSQAAVTDGVFVLLAEILIVLPLVARYRAA